MIDIYTVKKNGRAQDWHDPTREAAWQTEAERPGPSPFRAGGCAFESLPAGRDPCKAIIDVAHTWHIKGIGCDFTASAIMLCARKGLFGPCGRGKLERCLEAAYTEFMKYCTATGKTTGVRGWSKLTDLGMTSQKDFPTTISGKGYDTGLVAAWLGAFLEEQD